MHTVTITVGDVRGVGPRRGERVSARQIEHARDVLAGALSVLFTTAYDPNAGAWQGEPEGTLVVVGQTDSLDWLRHVIGTVAVALDQEAVGLIAQEGTDTLVWNPAAVAVA